MTLINLFFVYPSNELHLALGVFCIIYLLVYSCFSAQYFPNGYIVLIPTYRVYVYV